jgi:hypothetical protein
MIEKMELGLEGLTACNEKIISLDVSGFKSKDC